MAFRLDISTPERKFFSGEVDSLVLPTSGGEIGFMRDHSPVAVAVSHGKVTMRTGSDRKDALVSGGLFEMAGGTAVLLCDYAEWPEEIDVVAARIEKERAEELLVKKMSKEEYAQAKAALERAILRLKHAARGQ